MNAIWNKVKSFFLANESNNETLKEQVVSAVKTVYDPEIPVNIYDLGLIYDIHIDKESHVKIQMTLTSPGCPVAATFPQTVENAVVEKTEANTVQVELMWEPPWTMERMSQAARLQLNMMN